MASKEQKSDVPVMAANIIDQPIVAEMRQSYVDYAMSVITGRALPDVRDGLKPVHRRILYTMLQLGPQHTRPLKKWAGMVGDALGKYHPHGDAALYDSLVRMAQDFSLRYPLVEGQGNWGSVDGDSAAAMRYTEARLSKMAEEILADIDKDTVDFLPNYDNSTEEPTVLPSRVPNLLVNGTAGIAVGMATNIPPHNLQEVAKAIVAQIDNPAISLKELMDLIPGPDFPTGGLICGRKGILEAYASGKGKMIVRAKANVEEAKERKKIIVTELPYQVNKALLIEAIADLVKERRIEGIADLRDESDREGMRVVIELKKGADEQVVLNQLYAQTQLQTTFGVTLLAIVGGGPKIL